MDRHDWSDDWGEDGRETVEGETTRRRTIDEGDNKHDVHLKSVNYNTNQLLFITYVQLSEI